MNDGAELGFQLNLSFATMLVPGSVIRWVGKISDGVLVITVGWGGVTVGYRDMVGVGGPRRWLMCLLF